MALVSATGRSLLLAGLFACAAFPASAAPVADLCISDLEAIPGFLRANDAGAQEPVQSAVQARTDSAFESAQRDAALVEDNEHCTAVLQTYLKAWRKGHLFVQPVNARVGAGSSDATRAAKSRAPLLRLLSSHTALLTLPSFSPQAREPLRSLLAKNRRQLAKRPNWIIDVRGNDGGADTTYAALLAWLLPDGWIEVSEMLLVTPANIKAQEHVCELFAPGDAECDKQIQDSLRRMRSALPGSWVQHEDGDGWRHERPSAIEQRRPARVAVLMDSRCGSSCEAFLLTVRQGFAVKLVGHSRSYGELDASNLRPYLLPSGERRLWYTTTRSNRLPGLPLDGIGISPDIYLPAPQDATDSQMDITRTQRWLEGGNWRRSGVGQVTPR